MKNKSTDMNNKSFMNNKSLDDLNKKIKDAQNKPKSFKRKPKKVSTGGDDLGMGMKIASDLIAGVLVGLFLGINIDTYFGTSPLFIIIFVLVGFIAGMVNMYRTAQQMEQSRKQFKLSGNANKDTK